MFSGFLKDEAGGGGQANPYKKHLHSITALFSPQTRNRAERHVSDSGAESWTS
jgi:hypothetical protein